MKQLSKEAIEAIINSCNTVADSKCCDFSKAAMIDALTDPDIYEKAGLMRADGLLPESFNNEKVLTLLAISLRHLNAEQLAHLLKSITQRSKEATENAGLISLSELNDLDDFIRWRGSNYYLSQRFGGWVSKDGIGCVTRTTSELFLAYQEFYKS